MQIIAYTYSSGVHCPDCAREAYKGGEISEMKPARSEKDEHGLLLNLQDGDNNFIHPVFSTDEHGFTHCDDCRAKL